MPLDIPWTFVGKNVLSAALIVAYLAYEIRYGKGAQLEGMLEGLVNVVVALAEEEENIDEEAVVERLNEDRPQKYKEKYVRKRDGQD